MIHTPECPRCAGTGDPGPLCALCQASEVYRAVEAVRRLRGVTDLDERAQVLAELGVVEVRRRRCGR